MSPARRSCLLLILAFVPGFAFAPPLAAQTWSTEFAGPFLNGPVHDMAVIDGKLVVAGNFTLAGTAPVDHIAVWNGTRWQGGYDGVNGPVFELVADGTRNFWAAGDSFTVRNRGCGGLAYRNEALSGTLKWGCSGRSDWGGRVRIVEASGHVLASGQFDEESVTGGGAFVMDVGQGSYLGQWLFDEPPRALTYWNGEVYAGIQTQVYRFDGSAWVPFGPHLSGAYDDMTVFNGDLVVAGTVPIARWTGASWEIMKSTTEEIHRLEVVDGTLYALGRMAYGSVYERVQGVHRWTGSGWVPVGGGFDAQVLSLVSYQGRLIAGGWFRENEGGQRPHFVAQLVGDEWMPLESFQPGMTGLNGPVEAVLFTGSRVMVGGSFTIAGGIEARHVALWNGVSWSPLGTGTDGPVNALIQWNDLILAGGEFRTAGGIPSAGIAAWDGSRWHPMDGGLTGDTKVVDLAEYDGSVYACGTGFFDNGIFFVRWTGTEWVSVNDLPRDWPPYDLEVHEGEIHVANPNIVPYVHPMYPPPWGVVKWNGLRWATAASVWLPYENGGHAHRTVYALRSIGDALYLGGNFTMVYSNPMPKTVAGFTYTRDGTWFRPRGIVRLLTDPWYYGSDIAAVKAIEPFQDLVAVGGLFEHVEGNPDTLDAGGFALWNGADLIPAGGFFSNGGRFSDPIPPLYLFGYTPTKKLPADIHVLATRDHQIYVGGAFLSRDGHSASYLSLMEADPVPVDLIDFRVRWQGSSACVSWETAGRTEDAAGFNVHRELPGGDRLRVNDGLIGSEADFTVFDPGAPPEGARYWLEEVSRIDPDPIWHGPVTLGAAPWLNRIVLAANVPNPFAESTTIRFHLPAAGRVSVRIVDLSGRLVADLVDAMHPAGENTATWDGRTLDGRPAPGGIYFAVVRGDVGTATQKILRMR